MFDEGIISILTLNKQCVIITSYSNCIFFLLCKLMITSCIILLFLLFQSEIKKKLIYKLNAYKEVKCIAIIIFINI